MDFKEVAVLGDEIVLLGRIAAKVGFRIKDSNFGLNRSEIEICRVIAILSRELGRDRIPMSLVFKVLPALEASVSRTIGSLESKGYIKKIYARDKGEKRGRIYLSLTAKGGKTSDLVSRYFIKKIVDMLKEVLEPRLPKRGPTGGHWCNYPRTPRPPDAPATARRAAGPHISAPSPTPLFEWDRPGRRGPGYAG